MEKHRIHTTISTKHYELLKKHVEKYGTQQSVLEHALEYFENYPYQNSELSPEEELRVRVINVACIVYKDLLRILHETADIEKIHELIKSQRPVEFSIEFYFQKPLKECTLEEVVEGIVVNAKMVNWCDTVYSTNNKDHYTVNLTHGFGLNASKNLKLAHESLFKTYGVDFKTTISEKTVFMKIFKKSE